mgnify:FL=1
MTDLGLILSVLGIEVGPSGCPVLSVGEGADARILLADGEDGSDAVPSLCHPVANDRVLVGGQLEEVAGERRLGGVGGLRGVIVKLVLIHLVSFHNNAFLITPQR